MILFQTTGVVVLTQRENEKIQTLVMAAAFDEPSDYDAAGFDIHDTILNGRFKVPSVHPNSFIHFAKRHRT